MELNSESPFLNIFPVKYAFCLFSSTTFSVSSFTMKSLVHLGLVFVQVIGRGLISFFYM